MNESKVNALIDEQIAKLEQEKEEFQKKLDEIEREAAPADEWPKKGDRYYYVSGNGVCHYELWEDIGVDYDRQFIGNTFRTMEEADAVLQRLKDLAVLRKDAKGFVPDWSDGNQTKYRIYYDNVISDNFYIVETWLVQEPVLYFKTEKDASNSIRQHKAEWLRLLGVTEK